MKHDAAEDEMSARAALYALGALTQYEAQAFESHLTEDCKVCPAELRDFAEVVAQLGFETKEAEPSASAREALLKRLVAAPPRETISSASPPQFLTMRANEGPWLEVAPGAFFKRLFADRERETVTWLAKLQPGSRLPKHRHHGVEESIVMEGACWANGELFGPGDYRCALAGSVDEVISTVGGTTFLLIAPMKVEWLNGSESDGRLRNRVRHDTPIEECCEQAALYALGALTQSEASAFESHLADGCAACEAELPALTAVVAHFGFGLPEAAPPAEARAKLLARVGQEAPAPRASAAVQPMALPQFLSLRTDQGEWREIAAGVLQKKLFEDPTRGTITSLYKLLPGTSVPPHHHPGVEECFVFEGDFRVNHEVLGPGDYHCARPGSVHQWVSTVHGATLLIVT
jgi:anti-sigma factor ChrR (cupin superfamily)